LTLSLSMKTAFTGLEGEWLYTRPVRKNDALALSTYSVEEVNAAWFSSSLAVQLFFISMANTNRHLV
jgi:hypothetical protein